MRDEPLPEHVDNATRFRQWPVGWIARRQPLRLRRRSQTLRRHPQQCSVDRDRRAEARVGASSTAGMASLVDTAAASARIVAMVSL